MKKSNPINITHIDHVVLCVNDLDNMITFYQEVLGCKLERGPGEGRLAQLRAGHSLIDLVADGPSPHEGGVRGNPAASNLDHICFQLQPWDLNALRDHFARFGIALGDLATRYGASGMGPSVYLSDPEGNKLELKGSQPLR